MIIVDYITSGTGQLWLNPRVCIFVTIEKTQILDVAHWTWWTWSKRADSQDRRPWTCDISWAVSTYTCTCTWFFVSAIEKKHLMSPIELGADSQDRRPWTCDITWAPWAPLSQPLTSTRGLENQYCSPISNNIANNFVILPEHCEHHSRNLSDELDD